MQADQAIRLQAGQFLTTAEAVENLVVSVDDQRPVFLKQVAEVLDGPAEATTLLADRVRAAGLYGATTRWRTSRKLARRHRAVRRIIPP